MHQRNNAKAAEWLPKAVATRQQQRHRHTHGPAKCQRRLRWCHRARDMPGSAVSAAEQGDLRPSGRPAAPGRRIQITSARNHAGYSTAAGKTAELPLKDYWNAHLGRLPRKPGFGDRLALDVVRLSPGHGHADQDRGLHGNGAVVAAGRFARRRAPHRRGLRPHGLWAPGSRRRATSAPKDLAIARKPSRKRYRRAGHRSGQPEGR